MGIFETVGKFITEHSPYTYIVGATLLVIILCIILGAVISAISKKNKNADTPAETVSEEKIEVSDTKEPVVEEVTVDEVVEEETEEETTAVTEEVKTEETPVKKTTKTSSNANKTTAKKTQEKEVEQPKPKKEDHSAIYHVTKRKVDGKWQVKYRKGEKAIKLFNTQAEAITYAKKLASSRDGSVTVHKTTGQIRKH